MIYWQRHARMQIRVRYCIGIKLKVSIILRAVSATVLHNIQCFLFPSGFKVYIRKTSREVSSGAISMCHSLRHRNVTDLRFPKVLIVAYPGAN